MHFRISHFHPDEELLNHLFYFIVNVIPHNISVLIFIVELWNKLMVMDLSQIMSIIHNCEMGLIYFQGSLIQNEVVICCSYPKYFIEKHFQWFYLLIKFINENLFKLPILIRL